MSLPCRVLVVDDEKSVRDLVAEVLALDGLAAQTADSAEDALTRIEPLQLDLVLSDLRMPGAGGFHLLGGAKAIDPTLPFVLMTGYSDVESSVEALRLGADDFLTKPLKVAELRRVCRRAMEKGRLLRENLEQKRRLERLYQVKSLFIANMSHELRTPLTTIIGMSEVLGDQMLGDLNPKQSAYIATIQASAGHLLAVINDILDYSKIEAGKMVIQPGEFAAAEVMSTARSVVEGMAIKKRIEVVLVEPPAGTTAPGDRCKVIQILVNLLSNAVKFSAEGAPVTLRAEIGEGELRFAVRDRGIGIPGESLATIFHEFQQVHGGASGKDPGTGLGLALSRKLAQLHGGDLEVESVFGQGSTFTLRLPLVAAVECAAAAAV